MGERRGAERTLGVYPKGVSYCLKGSFRLRAGKGKLRRDGLPMASVMQEICRSWDVQELMFQAKNERRPFNSVERFWKLYKNGAQIEIYVRRTAYSGLTNSARIFEHGADYEIATVQKDRYPIDERLGKRLEKLAKPSCGKPNCGHTWDNSGMTHVGR